MKNNKILYFICAILTIIAIIIIANKGLNFDIKYSPSKQIEIYMGKQFDNKDIHNIVKEVVGDEEILVQKVEVYNEIVRVTVSDVTDEQVKEINTKINEKYDLNNTVGQEVQVNESPNLRGRDMAKPYILPIAISLIIILVYAGIRFRKIEILEVLGSILGLNIFAEILYVSILAITRLPVNALTLPIGLAIYTIVTIVVFNDFETRDEKARKEEKKKNKK